MLELAFVVAPRQNHFFVELVHAVRDELHQIGIASAVHLGDFPEERDDLVYVLTPPHEWFALHGARRPPSKRQLRRTIFLCAEQPETSFFVDNALMAPFAGAVFDISRSSREEFEQRHMIPGVHPFQLGWTRTWTTLTPDDSSSATALARGRDRDVLHLGIYSERRARAIAAAARPLSRWNAHLVLAQGDVPNDGTQPGFAIDEEKLDLFRRSRLLLNIHQDGRPYFEWLRVVQAMCQGCAVVTEHSVAHAPLELGTHMLGGLPESLGLLCSGLLDHEDERAAMAARAHAFLREELPLAHAVERMATVAGDLLTPTAPPARDIPPLRSPPAEHLNLHDVFGGPAVEDPDLWRSTAVRRGLKDLRLDMVQLRRDLRRTDLERTLGRRAPDVVLDSTTRAWDERRRPSVSVITALYNHDDHIADALESALHGTFVDLELVIVDDGSTDRSAAVAREVMARHPARAIALIRHPVNRGLGSARNSALAMARGRYVFVLDADNHVLPHGIARLVSALEADATAGLAYGMLEIFGASGPIGLTSFLPWEPRRFRNGNYIDAMALWRVEVLRACRGYTTDLRLYGWEDYDLFCRFAERAGRAAFVTQPVARYRSSGYSMISTTDLSVAAAFSILIERYPVLFAGVTPPP